MVDTGHRGVKTTFGKVQSESLPEGLYFYNPLTSNIIELDTRVLRWDDQTQAYTKDVQQAEIKFAVNYRLHQDKAHLAFAEVGVDWSEKLMPQIVLGAIKNEMGQWNAVDIIANRAVVQNKITDTIAAALLTKNIDVERFEITNIDYDVAFEKAVEQKVIAQQEAIREQNRTKQIEEQAHQKVLQAEAEAKSIQIRAQALERNAKLVEWEAVQKWDGKLPQYMLGSGAMPFIQLDKK
jgi:regulator of protease activity HflC (stomatin/prohibitin superfamily)